MSPFKDKELEQLAQQILNNATLKQKPVPPPNLLVDRLRQSIFKRQTKLPRV